MWLIDILRGSHDGGAVEGDAAEAERLNQEASPSGWAFVRRRGACAAATERRAHRPRPANAWTPRKPAFKTAIATSRAATDPVAQWEGHSDLAELYRGTGRAAEAGREYRSAIGVIEGERSKIGRDEVETDVSWPTSSASIAITWISSSSTANRSARSSGRVVQGARTGRESGQGRRPMSKARSSAPAI